LRNKLGRLRKIERDSPVALKDRMLRILPFLTLAFLAVSSLHAQETVLRAGHQVQLRIANVPASEQSQINGLYHIDDDGKVKIPHLGNQPAAGLTPSKLANQMEAAFRNAGIFSRPVIIDSTSATDERRKVSVSGEVGRVGLVAFSDGLRVSEAITAAGGYSDFSRGEIRLTRAGEPYKLSRKQISADPKTDIVLEPGDALEVR